MYQLWSQQLAVIAEAGQTLATIQRGAKALQTRLEADKQLSTKPTRQGFVDEVAAMVGGSALPTITAAAEAFQTLRTAQHPWVRTQLSEVASVEGVCNEVLDLMAGLVLSPVSLVRVDFCLCLPCW